MAGQGRLQERALCVIYAEGIISYVHHVADIYELFGVLDGLAPSKAA